MQKRPINPATHDSTVVAVPLEGTSIDKFIQLLLHKLNLTLRPHPKPQTDFERDPTTSQSFKSMFPHLPCCFFRGFAFQAL